MAVKSRNKYYNPNPLKKETGDCVVRAICKATGKDWDTVYMEIGKLGFEMKEPPNYRSVWKKYLENNNFIYHSIPVKKGSKRPTVASFAETHTKGTFVLRVAKHIVTCEDGYYYDLADFADSAVYSYYEKP